MLSTTLPPTLTLNLTLTMPP
uniref:Uncharacterized protein n=1 Tax=Anguilla anguilla TaxID=7936 RepID=A0A0E9ST39_ANGAN